MSDIKCADCTFRAKYDQNPASFLGKLWRWHASWCPGWKSYMHSLSNEQRIKIAEQYNLKKFL